jgi:hypothetical protein
MTTAHTHDYRVGDLVQTFYWDTGSASPGNVYGIVTSVGPKRVGVTWESGRRQSLHRERWHLIKHVPDNAREDALHATKHLRAELLAKLTAKQEADLQRRGKLHTYAIEPDGTVQLVKVKP